MIGVPCDWEEAERSTAAGADTGTARTLRTCTGLPTLEPPPPWCEDWTLMLPARELVVLGGPARRTTLICPDVTLPVGVAGTTPL
mmetsp:Transcript_86039/g.179920  ORF Transcript_86039/g.179920 Transcript_86039/m.179920 type:complete len:85 (-) Transcript_86039:922-1176(-)